MRYKPMLASVGIKEDLNRKGYLYEPKLDGTRAICYKNNKLDFINWRGRNISSRYPELTFLKNIDANNCVLDGEIIIYNEKGNPDFNLLQRREQISNKTKIALRSTEFPATYVIFDILSKNGKDLTQKSLRERKNILQKTVKESKRMQTIFYTKNGESLWKVIEQRKIEGVMAKTLSGLYEPGHRSASWLKIKFFKTIDCIILGYTKGRRIISSLSLGAYENDELIYIGKVGTGFTEKSMEILYKYLKKIEKSDIKKIKAKALPANVQMVKPKYVCEVKYLELSKDKKLRFPIFLRLRKDKSFRECILPQ